MWQTIGTYMQVPTFCFICYPSFFILALSVTSPSILTMSCSMARISSSISSSGRGGVQR
jgi:hypothetical protein